MKEGQSRLIQLGVCRFAVSAALPTLRVFRVNGPVLLSDYGGDDKAEPGGGLVELQSFTAVCFRPFLSEAFRWCGGSAHALAGARAAEDIAQEAFWAAFKKWDDLENPERWLWKVIANRSRSVLRRRYLEARLLPHAGPEPQPGHAEKLPGLDEFWDMVRTLPKRQAQVVALVYVEELSSR